MAQSMMSVSPRFDLVRFCLPKEFLPDEVTSKWQKFINKDQSVITRPIDYLNESIRGVSIPGLSDLTVTQQQHSSNSNPRVANKTWRRVNVDPNQNNTTVTTDNPLSKIDRKITIRFRMNQGLYNYWMLYESIFYRICKHERYADGTDLFIDVLNEHGIRIARCKLFQCHVDGLDGLEFDYSKVERQTEEFTLTLTFNNLDYDFLDDIENCSD